jgi:hypothetical protein
MAEKVEKLRQSSDADCEAAIANALRLYGARAIENICLSQLSDSRSKLRILGSRLMEHGDARAFALGRELVAMGKGQHDGAH